MNTAKIPDSDKQFQYTKIWDPFIRSWHWLLVFSVVSGWLLGEFRTFSVMQWHIYCGYMTGILLILRILWGFMGPTTVRFNALAVRPKCLMSYAKTIFNRQPSASAGHNPLGALSVVIMLVLLSIQVVSGLFSEDDGLFYSGPFASMLSSAMVVKMTAIHDYFSRLVLVFVLLHVAAILFYLIWKKENLIKAMITGNKLVKKTDSSNHKSID